MLPELPRRALVESRVIAVLGARGAERSGAAGFYVPEYLSHHGYTLHAVNPRLVGASLWGNPVTATLAEVPQDGVEGPVDLVDVFRRADLIPSHVPDILAMTPLPSFVWFQLGIRNDPAAAELRAAGIEVIQDRCTLADHRQL